MYFYVVAKREPGTYTTTRRAARKSAVKILYVEPSGVVSKTGNYMYDSVSYKCKGSIIGFFRLKKHAHKKIHIQEGDIYLW